MLTIRNAQIAALQAVVDDALVERLRTHLAAFHPDTLVERAGGETRALIREGIRKARGHGLVAERSLADFVVYGFTLGPAFDEHPAFAAEFGRISGAESPDARFAAIGLTVPAEAYEEVRQRAALPTPPSGGPPADV